MPPEDQIDIDTGRFRMKFGTLLTVMGTIIAIVVGAVAWGVGTATKADVEAIIVKHSKTPHANENGKAISAPADVADQVAKNTDAVKDLSGKMDGLKEQAKEGKSERKYIRSRIDFLTERAVIEGQQDPQARRHVARAASRVRSAARAAGDTDDPLEGVDGL